MSYTRWNKRLIVRLLVVIAILVFLYHGGYYFLKFIGFKGRIVNSDALKGFTYCSVTDTSMSNFSKMYPCHFKPAPKPNDVLIVTFVNSGWIPLARNWICSAEKVGLKGNLYVVSFERGVCSKLPGVPCYEHPTVHIKQAAFSQPQYQKLVIERTRIILKLLSCWPKIFLVDADITFLKNPLSYLKDVMIDKDIVFQTDSSENEFVEGVLSRFFHYICGGFIYMKSNYATKQLWLSVLQYQEKFLWNDQAGLNVCIRYHSQSVQWTTLDSEYFPNGQQFFFNGMKSSKNIIVHSNHLKNYTKIAHMIGSDVWCYKEFALEMCGGRTYKKHCSPRPSGVATPKWCLHEQFIRACRTKYNMT